MNETTQNAGGTGAIKRSQSALAKASFPSVAADANSQNLSSAYSSTTSSSTMSSACSSAGSFNARRRLANSNKHANAIASNRGNVTTPAAVSESMLNSASLEQGFPKSSGFDDDSDEYCDSPRKRYSMIDDFPDLIKGSSGEARRKRFLSRGLTRLFRRATMLSASSSSGLYKVTSFDGGGGKSYSESNLTGIHLDLPDSPSSASSTLTRVKTSNSTIPDNNRITTRNVQVKFAKRVRPASMYTSTALSSSIYSTGKPAEDKECKKLNEQGEINATANDIGIITSKEKEQAEQNPSKERGLVDSKKKVKEDIKFRIATEM